MPLQRHSPMRSTVHAPLKHWIAMDFLYAQFIWWLLKSRHSESKFCMLLTLLSRSFIGDSIGLFEI